MNPRGFTLIGLVVGTLVAVIAAYGMGRFFTSYINSAQIAGTRTETQSDVFALSAHILKIVRHAGVTPFDGTDPCTSNPNSITCQVNFTIPYAAGVANVTQVRFRFDDPSDTVVYETFGPGWNPAITYRNIVDFEVCGEVQMVTANNCPIVPTRMSDRHDVNRTAIINLVPPPPAGLPNPIFRTPTGRFFRYRITGRPPTPAGGQVQPNLILQGAVYARNPPEGDAPVYQWGAGG